MFLPMLIHFLRLVTNFGDLDLLLPLSVVVAFTLWRSESRAAAAAFVGALVLCLATLAVLKLTLLSCGATWRLLVRSPSGHVGGSTIVYGTIALVLATHTPRVLRPLWLGGWVALVALVATSRVVLHMHSEAEVVIGLAIGLAAFSIFAWRYVGRPHPRVNPLALGFALSLTSVVAYGSQSSAELWLKDWVALLRLHTGICWRDAETTRFAAPLPPLAGNPARGDAASESGTP